MSEEVPNLFYCYSSRFRDELHSEGFRHLHIGWNLKTEKYFWVFHVNSKLKKFLESRERYKG